MRTSRRRVQRFPSSFAQYEMGLLVEMNDERTSGFMTRVLATAALCWLEMLAVLAGITIAGKQTE